MVYMVCMVDGVYGAWVYIMYGVHTTGVISVYNVWWVYLSVHTAGVISPP
jgi:hypothetical protein